MIEKKNSSCIDCGMQEEAPLLPSTIAIPPQASLYRLQRFSPTTTTNTDVSPESMMDGFTDSAAAACTPLKMDRHGSHRGPSPDPMEEVSCVSAPRAGSRSAVDVVDAADPLARAAQWSSRRPASAAEFGREAPKSSGGSDGSRHHHHHHQHHQRTSGRGTARPLHGQNPDDVEEGRDASARLCNTVQLTPSPREEVPKRSLTPPHDSLRLIHDRLRSQRTPDRHASSSSSHAVDTRRSIPKAQRSPDTRRSPPNAAQRSPNPRRSPLKAATYANASTVIAALHTPSPKVRGGRIKVVVRKRPMNMDEGGEDCVRVASPALSLSITKHRVDLSEYTERNDFSFDDSFDESTHNEAIFASCGRELLDVAMQGGSASFFAYGQTGSGKTYTMMGTNEDKGLYLLSAEAVFEQLSRSQQVSVAFYEIYCNSLFDLLNNRTPVILREGSDRRVNVCGLTWHNIGSATELWRLIETGQDQRRTGSTSANERSSRSHAVMSLQIRDEDAEDCCGMFNFVDLAGSERAADTANNDKQTRLEGAEINKSLLALKECIRALDEKKRHVPFRGSRLTEVLRDSFMGNSKTVMVANISPSSSNYDHTVNTLRYAFRVKGLSIESVGPSKARNAPRPMPTSLRSRSAPNLPDLRAADQENSASGCTPLALRSPNTSAKTDSGIPQHHHYQQRGRSGRPGNRQTESSSNSNNNNNNNFSPSTPQVTPNKYDSTECSTAGRGDVDGDGDGSRRQRSNIRRRFLQPLSEADGTSAKSASANTMRRPPSAELRAMEERLQAKIMKQLQLDLGNEIQNILDGRDALIAALRKENAELKSQLACCQCGSPSMFPDENFSPGAPPPTLKPSDLQKRVSFDHDL